MLAEGADDLPVRAHGRRVVEIAAVALGRADDRDAARSTCRELVERFGGLRDEGRAQQQVFRRIARDRELGEGNEVAPGRFGGFVGGDQPRDVSFEIADDEVVLCGGDTQAHAPRIRGTSLSQPTGGTACCSMA